jgi:hypothetical protein
MQPHGLLAALLLGLCLAVPPFQPVSAVEDLGAARACELCCTFGRCVYDAAESNRTQTDVESFAPIFRKLQCCGQDAGKSYCCPLYTIGESARQHQPVPSQQCSVSSTPPGYECITSGSEGFLSSLPHRAIVSVGHLAIWEIIVFVIAGFVFCGCITGGGHRAYK